MISRRSILRAVPLLFAAPAIVRAASLMRISPLPLPDLVAWGDVSSTLIVNYDLMISNRAIWQRQWERFAEQIRPTFELAPRRETPAPLLMD